MVATFARAVLYVAKLTFRDMKKRPETVPEAAGLVLTPDHHHADSAPEFSASPPALSGAGEALLTLVLHTA